MVCGASRTGRGRGEVWRVSTVSAFCQSLSSGTVSALQRSAVNLKSNATEYEAVLGGENRKALQVSRFNTILKQFHYFPEISCT